MKAKTNIIAFSHFHSMFVKFGRLNCGAHISRCLISKCRWYGVTVRRISAIVRSIFILFQTDNSHRFCVFLYGASIFFNLWNSIDKCMPSKNAVKYANKNEYTCWKTIRYSLLFFFFREHLFVQLSSSFCWWITWLTHCSPCEHPLKTEKRYEFYFVTKKNRYDNKFVFHFNCIVSHWIAILFFLPPKQTIFDDYFLYILSLCRSSSANKLKISIDFCISMVNIKCSVDLKTIQNEFQT